MGKGDQKSKRGKITRGSYGKKRPAKKSAAQIPVKVLTEKEEVQELPKKTVKAKKDSAGTEAKEAKPKASKTKKTED